MDAWVVPDTLKHTFIKDILSNASGILQANYDKARRRATPSRWSPRSAKLKLAMNQIIDANTTQSDDNGWGTHLFPAVIWSALSVDGGGGGNVTNVKNALDRDVIPLLENPQLIHYKMPARQKRQQIGLNFLHRRQLHHHRLVRQRRAHLRLVYRGRGAAETLGHHHADHGTISAQGRPHRRPRSPARFRLAALARQGKIMWQWVSRRLPTHGFALAIVPPEKYPCLDRPAACRYNYSSGTRRAPAAAPQQAAGLALFI